LSLKLLGWNTPIVPPSLSVAWCSETSSNGGSSTFAAMVCAASFWPLVSRWAGLSRRNSTISTTITIVAAPMMTNVPRQPRSSTSVGASAPTTVPPAGVPTEIVVTPTERQRLGSQSPVRVMAVE
jgi:hypothetical protein